MGLTLQVAGACDVYDDDAGERIHRLIELRTGSGSLPRRVGFFRRHTSVEVAQSSVTELQADATVRLGRDAVPHLLACDGWNTLYLENIETPFSLDLGEDGTLVCASITRLQVELRTYGASVRFPVEPKLAKKDIFEFSNTFGRERLREICAVFTLATDKAIRRSLPLWVVK